MKSLIYKVLRLRSRVDAQEQRTYLHTRKNPKYSNYTVGQFTYGEPSVLEWGEGSKLIIGKFCSISTEVTILLGGNHRGDWVSTFPFTIFFEEFKHITGHPSTNGDVIIGSDVWIGLGALILSGVTIGDGAIIAAHSVVTKNVEPYAVVGGNPARKIRSRFDSEVVDQLLKIKWWNWDIEKIKSNMTLILSPNIHEFLNKHLSAEIR